MDIEFEGDAAGDCLGNGRRSGKMKVSDAFEYLVHGGRVAG